MYLVVGLGNPGLQYKYTPHNAGFMTIDAYAKRNSLTFKKSIKFKGNICETNIGNEKVILLKPTTFMNNSGESVRPLMDYYNIPLSKLIVIYDDKDLDVGAIRIRDKGHSIPSHNGLKSIINHTGSNNFSRVRFGIGKQREHQQLMDHVLHKLSAEEKKQYSVVAEKCADAFETIITGGLEKAQQLFNIKV